MTPDGGSQAGRSPGEVSPAGRGSPRPPRPAPVPSARLPYLAARPKAAAAGREARGRGAVRPWPGTRALGGGGGSGSALSPGGGRRSRGSTGSDGRRRGHPAVRDPGRTPLAPAWVPPPDWPGPAGHAPGFAPPLGLVPKPLLKGPRRVHKSSGRDPRTEDWSPRESAGFQG